jgi:hypothetical protein
MSELDKGVVIDDILLRRIYFYEWNQSVRLASISIKVDPTGVLAILKGITAEGPVVAFKGSTGIYKLCMQLRDKGVRETIKWRRDDYAIDNLEKKE